MDNYSRWSHWFPTHRGLTASQYSERAVLLARTLARLGLDRPHQSVTNTDPGHQFKAALSAVLNWWASRRRIEARSGLRAAMAADDRAFAGRLNRAADVALLARLDQGIAAARDRAARLARIRPIHRMM